MIAIYATLLACALVAAFWETAGVIVLMLAGMALYGTLITVGARFSRIHFAADGSRSLWGWPFTP